jgi:hypothetical protein
VNRLEAVPHVRQRAPDDHAHRVVEIRALHLHFEADRLDPAVTGRTVVGLECGVFGGLVERFGHSKTSSVATAVRP